jgi:hypothetical protein
MAGLRIGLLMPESGVRSWDMPVRKWDASWRRMSVFGAWDLLKGHCSDNPLQGHILRQRAVSCARGCDFPPITRTGGRLANRPYDALGNRRSRAVLVRPPLPPLISAPIRSDHRSLRLAESEGPIHIGPRIGPQIGHPEPGGKAARGEIPRNPFPLVGHFDNRL